MGHRIKKQKGIRPNGGDDDDDDTYLLDSNYDYVQDGYYKLQLPDGRELGCRPIPGSTETSKFITAGPANSGDLFRIDNIDWPAQETRRLFIKDTHSNVDKFVGRSAGDSRSKEDKLCASSIQSDSVLVYGDRADSNNFISLQDDDKIRLWVGEPDGSSGRNFVYASHGNVVSFQVEFIFVCEYEGGQ